MRVGFVNTTRTQGFTLLEVLVGMVILITGLVGFAGMVMMQAQGGRVAKGTDEAATIMQSTVESLNNIVWADLGTDPSLPSTKGLSDANVWILGPLNRLAEPIGTGTGPYLYYRSTVVCQSGHTVAAGATPQYCGSALSGNNRPPELACDTLTLSSREKMIRMLVSWTDRNGKCHYVRTDSLSFDWQGT